MSLPHLLDAQEAADFLKKPRKYVLNLARSGKLDAYRIGREYRFAESHLLAYLERSSTYTKTRRLRPGSPVTATGLLTEQEVEARADRFFSHHAGHRQSL